MKRLNNLFVILFILIGLLSITYIWKSEANRKDLEIKIVEQSQEIDSLKNKFSELTKIENNPGNIKGATTAIGTIIGLIQFENMSAIDTTIVCAQDKFTTKEFCTDELTKTNSQNKFGYILEIPKGTYLIYAINPPDPEKTYYSKIQKCADDDCALKTADENSEKILLEIIEEETQKDINLYF